MFPLRSTYFIRASHSSSRTTKFHVFLVSPLSTTASRSEKNRRYINGLSGNTTGQIGPEREEVHESQESRDIPVSSKWMPTAFKMFESAATTLASILVLA